MTQPTSILFQSAKLGDIPYILDELEWAKQLRHDQMPVQRVYGVSGGALVALAFSLSLAAQHDQARWGGATSGWI